MPGLTRHPGSYHHKKQGIPDRVWNDELDYRHLSGNCGTVSSTGTAQQQ
jgi:hypothetical protein